MTWEGFRMRPAISLTATGVLAVGTLIYLLRSRKRKDEALLKSGPPLSYD
jgi:hypothetical protein